MENKEIIETLEIAKAKVEWNYPMDYQIAMDDAIKCIGNGFDTYADSTLMTINKKDLIHMIRILEQNLRNAEETNNRQYELLKNMNN